jgi:hypothetical protein
MKRARGKATKTVQAQPGRGLGKDERDMIALLGRHFAQKPDGPTFWQAWEMLRENERALPPRWMLEVLDEIADRVMYAAFISSHKVRGLSPRARAVLMWPTPKRGRRSALQVWYDRQRDLEQAMEIKLKGGPREAARDADDPEVAARKYYRVVERACRFLERKPAEWLAQGFPAASAPRRARGPRTS